MLNAYTKDKDLVSLIHLSREEVELLKGEAFFCPACNYPVRVKNGKLKLPHFAHYNDSRCRINSEGETLEHISLKKMFAKWCEEKGMEYELEKYLPALNQRPDLLLGNIVLEIQCSGLSITRLIERTKMYLKHGYIPIWICGKKLFSNDRSLNEITKHLCYYSDLIGFYLWTADWEKEELIVYFLLEEDWKKRLSYSKKKWNFYENSLLEIFDFPFTAIEFKPMKYQVGKRLSNYYYELNKKLYNSDRKILQVQSELYNNRFHLLSLPKWFYYPGIHIFCCRDSDMLLKMNIWKLVQFFNQNVLTFHEIKELLEKEMNQLKQLFYDFPNIPFETVKKYCIQQLFFSLIDCHHLVKVANGWKINIADKHEKQSDLYDWFKIMENKWLIHATPIKNMIR